MVDWRCRDWGDHRSQVDLRLHCHHWETRVEWPASHYWAGVPKGDLQSSRYPDGPSSPVALRVSLCWDDLLQTDEILQH
jgi:hypothetical protein